MTPTQLRTALDTAGLRNIDLARLADVTPHAVSHWLAGRRPVPGYVFTLLFFCARSPDMTRWLLKTKVPDG
jgi:hypothetical protein